MNNPLLTPTAGQPTNAWGWLKHTHAHADYARVFRVIARLMALVALLYTGYQVRLHLLLFGLDAIQSIPLAMVVLFCFFFTMISKNNNHILVITATALLGSQIL